MGEAVSEYLAEASALLERARGLEGDERTVFKYFAESISVGTMRADEDLKRKGIATPMPIIRKLIAMGLLEEGRECYNLARPLREYVRRRGKIEL